MFMLVCRWSFFLEWEMCHSEVAKKIRTQILCSITFSKNSAIYELVWKNTRGQTCQTTIRCMRYACRITEAIDTCSKCVILTVCTRQQWLCKHASILRYKQNACYVLAMFTVWFYLGKFCSLLVCLDQRHILKQGFKTKAIRHPLLSGYYKEDTHVYKLLNFIIQLDPTMVSKLCQQMAQHAICWYKFTWVHFRRPHQARKTKAITRYNRHLNLSPKG
jgi:hypothetical protein